jgi:hypothetical protein
MNQPNSPRPRGQKRANIGVAELRAHLDASGFREPVLEQLRARGFGLADCTKSEARRALVEACIRVEDANEISRRRTKDATVLRELRRVVEVECYP